jgi:HPt (histidine-containing phosphotransfer) domain-containing protein
METEKVTDLTYLKELSKGDNSFVQEMIEIFLEENPGELSALRKSIDQDDFPMIYSSAHKLKSSTPFVGIYSRIRNHVLEIEDLAKRHERSDRMLELYDEIEKVCKKSREELQQMKATPHIET